MNFLSHYYYELPKTHSYFVIGLAIPDLVSHFAKQYNLKIKKAVLPMEPEWEEIHKGILAHYAADKQFHNSQCFLQQVSKLTQEFMQQGLDRSRLRLSVIAHVAVELMLDRQIYFHLPDICNRYYSVVELADEEVLGSYFDRMGLAVEKQDFISKFQFYKEKRFLERFNELENIVFGLGRIYSLVTKASFTPTENKQLLAALSNIDEDMRYRWQDFLNV